MFRLQILVSFLQLVLATSEENIYVDYESNPDHPFPVLRRDVPSLKTNIIAQSREPTYKFCGLKCADNRFCVAMNYKEKAEWNEWNCQLTNTTEQKFDNNASKNERVWTFIKVNVDRSQVASCRGEVNECHNGGTMIWDPIKPFNCLCREGYEGEICEKDTDECSHDLVNECDINANCTNTPGSYNCQCQIGWLGDGKDCSDIDECSEGNFRCHPNATCINTQGSYNCQCKNGYEGDGKENCTDNDECSEESTNECHLNATCSNAPGSYECQCRAGFYGHGRTCSDIDECSEDNFTCHPNATCINTQGSYNCQCKNGYEGDGKKNCTDLDECSGRNFTCHPSASCINTQGSYNCQCKNGYVGDGKKNCTDLDECSEGNFTCHPNATCINTPGSYNCQCKQGYEGDGKKKCTDPIIASVILSGELSYPRLLQSWIGGNFTGKLCWRATRDGWAASTFHSKCDYKKPTVTIVKVGQFIFGGYVTASSEANGGKQAPGSFMFSMRNKENLPPFKAQLKNQNDGEAIWADRLYGPIFGRGRDLIIYDNAASDTRSYTNFGSSYQLPSGVSDHQTILAGTYNFTPSEIEVFYLV